LRGHELQVHAHPAVPWQVDGEVGGQTPVHCRIEPRALWLIAPASRR